MLAISSGAIIALVVAGLAVAGAVAYYAHKQEQERVRALRGLARQLGWQFSVHKNRRHRFQYDDFEVFAKGEDQFAYNTLQGPLQLGPWQGQARAGDYEYTETRRDSNGRQTKSTTRFSYVVADLPVTDMHTLFIRPEGFFDKVAGSLGFDDIDFESAEFSRVFFVKSSDKRFAYDVIHPRMMELLLAARPPALEIAGGKCCLGDGSGRWEAEDMQRRIRFLERFFALWPEHVTAELRQSHA